MMFLVILHHCCKAGSQLGPLDAALLYGLSYVAVDGFVMISGWYGIRFKWEKLLKLWGCTLFYAIFIYALKYGLISCGVLTSPLTFHFGLWWFVGAYLALMVMAPIVNAGLEALAQKPRQLLFAWGSYAIFMTLSWLSIFFPLGFNVDGWGSHTANTLLFVYVTARTVRLLGWEPYLRRWGWKLALCYIPLFLLAIPIRSLIYYLSGHPLEKIMPGAVFFYNVPTTWVAALLLLGTFLVFHLPRRFGKVVSFIAPSMFGVYLFHEPMGELLFQRPQLWLEKTFAWMPNSINLLLSALFCFTICVIVDLLRRGGLTLLRPCFSKVWTLLQARCVAVTRRQ